MMDQDGANVRLLSQGRELVLTPRFSPTAQEITYMQYTGDQPRVPHEPGDGKARARGRFPRHDLRAALLTGRPAHRHEHRRGWGN